MFQSTPVITDERIGDHKPSCARPACFNPRPSLLTSESRGTAPKTAPDPCFNPRPSLLTSESIRRIKARIAELVSIHARHY